MKETILLFNAPAREELLKIETALFPLHIRLRKIKKEDYCQLNKVLAALRRCGAGPFPYKAILTPTNSIWTAPDCFDEIRREHEALHK